MAPIPSSHSADEIVQQAEVLYRQKLRAQVENDNRGRYIAIDIATGEYEIGDDYHAAAHSVLARKPDASIGVLRIGYATAGRIGGRAKAAPQ